jgi:hypothetical protein
MEAITAHLSSDNKDDPDNVFLLNVLQTWHDMFLDLMQCDHYSHALAEELEISMLLFLRNMQTKPFKIDNETLNLQPVDILALIDTQARWFRSWTAHISPQHLVSLIERTHLLPDLIVRSRAQANEFITSQSKLPKTRPLRLHSVALLAATVEKTRVALFPWHLLYQRPPSTPLKLQDLKHPEPIDPLSPNRERPQQPDTSQLDALVDIFLNVISDDLDSELLQMYCNAIETIFLGCNSMDKEKESGFDRVLLRGKGRLQDILSKFE